MAQNCQRISPEHKDFPSGLLDRNVLLADSLAVDPQSVRINLLATGTLVESEAEKESHDQLWALDQDRLNKGSNEALFQRTLMISLIVRHRLIYAREPNKKGLLDFSVEELWTCHPMPTRAYCKGETYLTQPKPDLAVFFARESLIPDHLWMALPRATKRLACYENTDLIRSTRVFHFLTIEAKTAKTMTDNVVGMLQSLNNASQALHNLFEFFKEAGPQHEYEFFAKVRFFSVVASTEGLAIRIHRASKQPKNGPIETFIIPEYPLKFEYSEFCSIARDKFERHKILETFEKILLGYGTNELHGLIESAAKSIVEKLREDPNELSLRGNPNFYRYKQTDIPPSKRTTPASSPALSVQDNMSSGLRQSRTTAPGQNQGQLPSQILNKSGKRPRENSPPLIKKLLRVEVFK